MVLKLLLNFFAQWAVSMQTVAHNGGAYMLKLNMFALTQGRPLRETDVNVPQEYWGWTAPFSVVPTTENPYPRHTAPVFCSSFFICLMERWLNVGTRAWGGQLACCQPCRGAARRGSCVQHSPSFHRLMQWVFQAGRISGCWVCGVRGQRLLNGSGWRLQHFICFSSDTF